MPNYFKFCQIVEILPNLVALLVWQKVKEGAIMTLAACFRVSHFHENLIEHETFCSSSKANFCPTSFLPELASKLVILWTIFYLRQLSSQSNIKLWCTYRYDTLQSLHNVCIVQSQVYYRRSNIKLRWPEIRYTYRYDTLQSLFIQSQVYDRQCNFYKN